MDILFLFVFLGAAAGGAVQSVAGFGGGVLMMLFLPSMFGLLHASASESYDFLSMKRWSGPAL